MHSTAIVTKGQHTKKAKINHTEKRTGNNKKLENIKNETQKY